MAPTKMTCKNSEKFSYTGKEMSPLGLGYCADAESVGTEMVGRDGKNWMVGVKNNDKLWMRAPEKPLKQEEPVIKADEEEVEETTEEDNAKPTTEEDNAKPTTEEDNAKPTTEEDNAKPTTEEDNAKPTDDTPKKEEKPKRKYTKKPKTTEPPATPEDQSKPADENVTPDAPVKPKRKYTKKAKQTDENGDVKETKERKKRGPSGYNLYIGMKMKELREKTAGLKTTDYMKQAQEMWGAMSKDEQKKLTEELKAASNTTEVM